MIKSGPLLQLTHERKVATATLVVVGVTFLISLTPAATAIAYPSMGNPSSNTPSAEESKRNLNTTPSARLTSPETKARLSTSQETPGKTGSRYNLSSSLSYAMKRDMAQDRDPALSTHRLTAGFGFSMLEKPVVDGAEEDDNDELFSAALRMSGQVLTVGNEIEGTRSSQGPAELSDLDASLSKSFKLNKVFGAKSSVELSGGSSFPTSEASQYEGVLWVPYAGVGWTLSFQGGRYVLMQEVSTDYIANTYSHSPTTREINSDGSVGYTISTSIRLGYGFKIGAGGSARVIHYIDDTSTAALSNFQSISWTKSAYTVAVRYSNGARAEDHQTSMWFVDDYRRVLTLGLTARF